MNKPTPYLLLQCLHSSDEKSDSYRRTQGYVLVAPRRGKHPPHWLPGLYFCHPSVSHPCRGPWGSTNFLFPSQCSLPILASHLEAQAGAQACVWLGEVSRRGKPTSVRVNSNRHSNSVTRWFSLEPASSRCQTPEIISYHVTGADPCPTP